MPKLVSEWKPGSKLVHPYNPELGTGVVQGLQDRFLTVYFPAVDREMTLSAKASGLTRLILPAGTRAEILESGEEVEVAEASGHDYILSDGRVVPDAALWPLLPPDTPIDQLAALRCDKVKAFRNRLDGMELEHIRRAGGLGSFLGGRIELFPHQLHTAHAALTADPVRWLLADEVGLGKTVEACLILTGLVHTGRAERALVVAPETLTIQWLGELYRKFHQIFVLVDDERIASVATDIAEDANPFDVHPFAVVSQEFLIENPDVQQLVLEADLDLLVVDEAHRLAQADVLDAVAPIVRASTHALLLTATPLQADRSGFWQLLHLLQPEAFPTLDAFEQALGGGGAIVPCTSAVRREDIGGLPPRVAAPVEVPPPDTDIARDARTRWLVERARGWQAEGEKALVFVRDLKTLRAVKAAVEADAQTAVALFHEDMAPERRDIELAGFRASPAPILLATQAGEEGRNFQFCDRMVMFDLPTDPVVLEQRIGRLDRIGRDKPVEIVYFRHQGVHPDIAGIYESLGLFTSASAGLELALAPLRKALEAALPEGRAVDAADFAEAVDRARGDREGELARVTYSDGYDESVDEELLERVPDDLDDRMQRFCLSAARGLGLESINKGGDAVYYLELGAGMRVDNLPGVPGDSRFLGTFSRAEAVVRDDLDFFSSGHPLIEGLLLELADGFRGRAALVELPPTEPAIGPGGLVCVYRGKSGPELRIVGPDGKEKPEWVETFLEALPTARNVRPDDWGMTSAWADAVRGLASRLDDERRPEAALFFRIKKPSLL